MKKLLFVVFLVFVATSVFGISLVGHWDATSVSEEEDAVVSFYADATFVITGEDGSLLNRGTWHEVMGYIYFDNQDCHVIKWVDDNNVMIGEEYTDNVVMLKRQGTE